MTAAPTTVHAARRVWGPGQTRGLGLALMRRAVLDDLLHAAPCLNRSQATVTIEVRQDDPRAYTAEAKVTCTNPQCVDPEYIVLRYLPGVRDTEGLNGRWYHAADFQAGGRRFERTGQFEEREDGAVAQVWRALS